MVIARQSTARTVMVGPVLDADGVAVTDCVVGDFEVSKNGGDPAALNGSATLTHRNTGHYSLALTSSDLDTVGQAEIVINDTVNACPVKAITIVEEAVYDAFFASSAVGYVANAPVNVAQFGGSNGTFASGRPEVNTTHAAGTAWGSGAITAASIASDAITAAKIATGAIDADAIADNAIDAGAIASDAITAAKIATGAITSAKFAAGAITAAAIATDAIDADALAADAIAEINATVDTALADYDGPTNAEMVARTLAAADYATSTALGTVDTVVDGIKAVTDALPDAGALTSLATAAALTTVDTVVDAIKVTTDKLDDTLEDQGGGTFGFTEEALQEAPSGGGGGPTAGEIADAVWDEDLTGHTTPDSAGDILGNVATGTPPTADAIADEVQTRTIAAVTVVNGLAANVITAAATAADFGTEVGTAVWANGTRTLSALDEDNTTIDLDGAIRSAVGLASANLDTQLDALPTAAENATASWAAGTRTLTALDEDNTTLDLDATIRGAVGLASANLDTQIADIEGKVDDLETRLGTPSNLGSGATVAANLVDIEAQTDDIGAAGAGLTALASASNLSTLQTSVNDLPTNSELATALASADDAVLAAIAGLEDLSAAEVLTQVQSALTATVADSVPADGSRPSIAQGIYLLTQFMLERSVSGTTLTVNKPDGTTALLTLTLNDDTNPTAVTRAS